MASGLFFDPLVVLRTAPLVSATCSLLFGRDQHFFLSILNQPDNRKLSNTLLPSYFKPFFRHGVVFVVGTIGVTTLTSTLNLYTSSDVLHERQSFWWYAAGTALAASHFLFVPFVAPRIRDIIDVPPGRQATDILDEWLFVNALRTMTVDLAAWVAISVAVIKSLRS